MEIHKESAELLERIANSLYDRHPSVPVMFTVKEIKIVEDFLRELKSPKSGDQTG